MKAYYRVHVVGGAEVWTYATPTPKVVPYKRRVERGEKQREPGAAARVFPYILEARGGKCSITRMCVLSVTHHSHKQWKPRLLKPSLTKNSTYVIEPNAAVGHMTHKVRKKERKKKANV